MIALTVVTVLAVAVAITMSAVAWRIAREERRRSDARVQGLAADIYAADTVDTEPSPVTVSGLFAANTRFTAPTFPYALAAGALVVGFLAAVIVGVSSATGARSHEPRPATTIEPVAGAEPRPLELESLEHEREGNGLVIRGTIRQADMNQRKGALVAVVFALNGEGVVVGSGRAPVEITSAPGAGDVESSFVVRIGGVGDIRRYRVSFRDGDRTVDHVDRRSRLVTARLP